MHLKIFTMYLFSVLICTLFLSVLVIIYNIFMNNKYLLQYCLVVFETLKASPAYLPFKGTMHYRYMAVIDRLTRTQLTGQGYVGSETDVGFILGLECTSAAHSSLPLAPTLLFPFISIYLLSTIHIRTHLSPTWDDHAGHGVVIRR